MIYIKDILKDIAKEMLMDILNDILKDMPKVYTTGSTDLHIEGCIK